MWIEAHPFHTSAAEAQTYCTYINRRFAVFSGVLCVSTQWRRCSRSPSDRWCSGHTAASPARSAPCCQVPAVGLLLWQPGAGRDGRSGGDTWTRHLCWCLRECPMCNGNAPALPGAPTHHRRSWEGLLWPPGMEWQVRRRRWFIIHHVNNVSTC